MESVLKSVLTIKFTTLKLETVTVLLDSEESMELVKSAQLEELQLLMEHVEAVESINNLLIVNASVHQVSFQMNLKFVPNAVKLQVPS